MGKISLRLTFLLFTAGMVLAFLSSLIGWGGKLYFGDWIGIVGLLLSLAMIFVLVYGHLLPALRKFLKFS